jgi:Protein of unknown function (DUF503)
MSIGVLTLQLQLPGCKSLKEKRSRLKPLIARLHREFNISVAEVSHQDIWDEATIGCDNKQPTSIFRKLAPNGCSLDYQELARFLIGR